MKRAVQMYSGWPAIQDRVLPLYYNPPYSHTSRKVSTIKQVYTKVKQRLRHATKAMMKRNYAQQHFGDNLEEWLSSWLVEVDDSSAATALSKSSMTTSSTTASTPMRKSPRRMPR